MIRTEEEGFAPTKEVPTEEVPSEEIPKTNMENAAKFMAQHMGEISKLDATSVTIIVVSAIVLVSLFLFTFLNRILQMESVECDRMNKMFPALSGYIHSLGTSSDDSILSYPLHDFYVYTAYNACSGGEYRNDYVSLCHLQAIIKQGVRGFDFEIFSHEDQPVVATTTEKMRDGKINVHVKETYNFVALADVVRTLVSNCFSGTTCPNPTDPVILHLRVRSTHSAMFDNMVKIFKSNMPYFLNPEFSYNGLNLPDGKLKDVANMSIGNFSKKIILIFDGTQGKPFEENTSLMEFINMVSGSNTLRLSTSYEIENSSDQAGIGEYNKQNMTIVTPDFGASPMNPDGGFARSLGCQMVAMRFQLVDTSLTNEISFFQDANRAFVLKPYNLRDHRRKERITEKIGKSYDFKLKTITVTPNFSFTI